MSALSSLARSKSARTCQSITSTFFCKLAAGAIQRGLRFRAWRVVRDDRIPTWIRGGLLGTAAYLVFPFDVIPDWVPVLGQLDDFLVVTIGVRTLLRRVPEPILREHWDGDPELLARILGREIAES